jgi:hypoxanthine phosphoribosyltransferase/molybdopterin converting factor small subunit
MRIRIRLLGQLKHAIGEEELLFDIESSKVTLQDLISTISKRQDLSPYFNGDGPRHDIILFVNGKDYRVYTKDHVFEEDVELTFIPISHGGIELYYVTWNDIEKYSNMIAEKISEDGYIVDTVIGIMRGGVIPARIIADYLGVRNMGIIEVMFYQRPGETRHKPVIRQPLTLDISDKNILIVDDVSDTGKSLQVALSAIALYGPSQIKTATLYIKPWTTFIPDYYAASATKWIVFPWEKNEVKRELE